MSLTGLTNLQPLHIKTVGIGTFDNTVSIGGTLTYEDVTNVDALGIGTFRAGIDITGGDLIIPDKIIHSGDTNTSIRFPSTDTIRLETGGTARLTVDSNGNTLTSGGLYAQGDLYIADSIIHEADTNTKIRFPAADTFTVETAGSERLRIDNNGTVYFRGSSSSDNHRFQIRVNDTDTEFRGSSNSTTNKGFAFYSSNTNASEKLRITSDGILIINQTSASGTKLAIQSTASSGSGTATGIRVGNNIGALSQYPANIEVRTTGVATYNAIRTDAGDGNGGFTCGVESYNGFLDLTTGGSNTVNVKLRASGASYLLGGDFGIGTNSPSGKLHIDGISSGDIIAGYTSGSPTFTYRNGGGSWMHAGKHPTANEFIISEGASTTTLEMLRIQGGGGTNDSKFKFPSVESPSAHGESTAHIEIGGRHIWKRITSTNHVTTSTSTNHFYLAFWRTESGTKRTCYYKGVVVNVVASGNYDWGGHGYVTHSSQTILSFGGTTTGVHNTNYNQGFNQINNSSGGTNMQLHNVAYSYDGTYLYANFRFKTNISGTGFKPHYNVEVIDPNQCTYTCEAF